MNTTLFWIRHGENPANITKEFSCRAVDYPLTAKGRLQAEQTAEYLHSQAIDALYCSPMRRTRETAQVIGERLGLMPVVVDELHEINVGDLEGQPPTAALWAQHDQVLAAWLDGRPELAFPGGENYHALIGRMNAGLGRTLDARGRRRIAVVGHGGSFWVFLPALCPGLKPRMLGENHNCSVSQLEVWRDAGRLTGRLLRYADISHLSGAAAELVSGILDPKPVANE